MKDLIIVESPTKAKTLSRFLKGDIRVEATMGHVRDLPKSELGVDTENDFAPSYIIPRDKSKRVTELVKIAADAEHIVLATDPDREGEAIAWHVANVLDQKLKRKKKGAYSRIVFHEITKQAIEEALAHPRTVDAKLVDAQQARRVLDRLVGYKLSPLLWKKLSRRWLSAGRVQSVAVRLIVEREREITAFAKEEYWTIDGSFSPAGTKEPVVVAGLQSKDGEKYGSKVTLELFDGSYSTAKTSIASEDDAKRIIADLKGPYVVDAVQKKEIRRSAPAPFTTSTMQQDAGRKLYFSAKKTMQIAQKLYEEGFITYHRTDSVHLSDKFVAEAREHIAQTYGKQYLPDAPKRFETKSKVAQEAHEAIRPTDVAREPKSLAGEAQFNRDHVRLYELIYKRAVASQVKEAVFDSTTLTITSANGYLFEAQGSVIVFDGYLAVMGHESDDTVIPPFTVGQAVDLARTSHEQHFTNPPPRYTEASLVKTLEEKEIGRPSTYAPIISTIVDRNYVEKEDKKLKPTELGNAVTDFLVQHFPDILSLPFTANLEGSLDRIADGEIQWIPVIRDFYTSFNTTLEKTYKESGKVKMAEEEIDEKCPECGSPLIIRFGRYGRFIACSGFPGCSYTRQHAETIDKTCPKCGGQIVIKKSRKGKMFYGCGNYPKCTFAAWKKEDIK